MQKTIIIELLFFFFFYFSFNFSLFKFVKLPSQLLNYKCKVLLNWTLLIEDNVPFYYGRVILRVNIGPKVEQLLAVMTREGGLEGGVVSGSVLLRSSSCHWFHNV